MRYAYFVDAGFWKAHFDRNDQWYAVVQTIFRELQVLQPSLFTSDAVILEFMTLTRSRGISAQMVNDWVEAILKGASVEYISREDFDETRRAFVKYGDKVLSGFDASSFAIADRLDIVRVLTVDKDFFGFGRFVEIRPNFEERKFVVAS